MSKSQSHLGLTGRSSCHRAAAAWPLCQASLSGAGLGERRQGEEQGEEGMLAVLGWGWGGEAFLYGVMSIPEEKRVSCSCLGLHVQMVHVHA